MNPSVERGQVCELVREREGGREREGESEREREREGGREEYGLSYFLCIQPFPSRCLRSMC